ncbi:hypothetical protein ACJJTC_007011 [Scirpophaga incertulas]
MFDSAEEAMEPAWARGRGEDVARAALALAHRALLAGRGLAAADPEVPLPRLGSSLTLGAAACPAMEPAWARGRGEDVARAALALAHRALLAGRGLAAADPEAMEPAWARGRGEDVARAALALAHRALLAGRGLAAADPEVPLPRLGSSLTLGAAACPAMEPAWARGRGEDVARAALALAHRALLAGRGLAAADPERWSRRGRAGAARTWRARRWRWRTARCWPAAGSPPPTRRVPLPRLGSSLTLGAAACPAMEPAWARGRGEDVARAALALAHRALLAGRGLAAADPEVPLPRLGSSLTLGAAACPAMEPAWARGRGEDVARAALALAHRALLAGRGLAAADPEVPLPRLGSSLTLGAAACPAMEPAWARGRGEDVARAALALAHPRAAGRPRARRRRPGGYRYRALAQCYTRTEALRALLPAAGLDAADARGLTVLMKAALAGDEHIVAMLLENGADPNIECGGAGGAHCALPPSPRAQAHAAAAYTPPTIGNLLLI